MNEFLSEMRAYFTTKEVLEILNIDRDDLYSIMRPVRTKAGLKPPLFEPETKQKLVNNWMFSQKDVLKLTAYFQVHKKYKAAEREMIKAKKELKNPKLWREDLLK